MNLDRSNMVSFTSDWSRRRHVTQFYTVIHEEKSSSRGAVCVKERGVRWGGVWRWGGQRESECMNYMQEESTLTYTYFVPV